MGTVSKSKRKKEKQKSKKANSGSPIIINNHLTDKPFNARIKTVNIENPYREATLIQAFASMRDDPLRRLYVRKQITVIQYNAGRAYQRLCEAAEIGSIKSLDTTKEAVDGGRFSEPLTDQKLKASKTLARLSKFLGIEGETILRDVLVKRLFIDQIAMSRGFKGAHHFQYFGRRFREALDTVSLNIGLCSMVTVPVLGKTNERELICGDYS